MQKGGDKPTGSEVPDLAAIEARVREMEEETKKLKQIQIELEKEYPCMGSPPGSTSPLNMSIEEKIEADNRSVYVGNVDYGATTEELERHFHRCGTINRVTILCNKFNGHPKGCAYIEFGAKNSVQTAKSMNETFFRGRKIKVMPKRTNKPGLSTTNWPPRGIRIPRGGCGRSFRGGFSPYYSDYRSVRRGRYNPY